MLIVIDDDRFYLTWIAKHRSGFVADVRRSPDRHAVVVHCAHCEKVKSRRLHQWTCGSHFKLCAPALEEIIDWVHKEWNRKVTFCPECQPQDRCVLGETGIATSCNRHRTRVEGDILSYVSDVAVIFLDGLSARYHVKISDIAEYVSKSLGQIALAVLKLVHDDWLTIDGVVDASRAGFGNLVVTPTAHALRLVPAFAELTDEQLHQELQKLRDVAPISYAP